MLRKTASGIMFSLLLISMTGLVFHNQAIRADQQVCMLLETDKCVYTLGENVTITLTNNGSERVDIGGYPAWQIFTYPGEEPVYPAIFASLAWYLDPGENDTFVWNQYNEFNHSFVKPGAYVVRDTQGWGLSAHFEIIAAEIIVPDDYPTIQEAVNAANPGDTIYVKAGTYYEHVTINNSISLIGEDRSTTIIDGSRNGTVISVIADYVNISRLTIQNGYHTPHITYGIKVGGWEDDCNHVKIYDNIVSDNDIGIFLYYSSNSIVFDNLIFDNYRGIDIALSNDNHIEGNSLFNNEVGVSIGTNANNNMIYDNEIYNNSFCGISVGWSIHNKIVGNMLSCNNEAGIRLDSSNHNNIIGNHIASNRRDGIVLYGSNSNKVVGNALIQNKWNGIALWYSNSNSIYHNNFLDNTKQAGSYSGSINIWDHGYPLGGNYWSNYDGTDLYSGSYQNETGSDGIGDTPYVIDGNNQDNYPLIAPFSSFNVTWDGRSYPVDFVSNSTISNLTFDGVEKLLSFDVTGPDDTLGICRVTVPKSLMKPSQSEKWQITIDGSSPLSTNIIENENSTYLYFTYEHSTHTVEIRIISEKVRTLLGVGWGWMRIAPKQYVYGRAELYKVGDTQIELIITYQGEEYSRTWNIIYHREYEYGERYLCYSKEWGFLIVGLHKCGRWQFWYAVGKGAIAFGFPRFQKLRLMPI